MTNPIDIKIAEFHVSVKNLSQEIPTSFFCRIIYWLTHFSSATPTTTHEILIKRAALQAEAILADLNLQNSNPIPPELKSKINRFDKDMKKLFIDIYPYIETNPFSVKSKLAKSIQEYFSDDSEDNIKALRLQKSENVDLINDPEHRLKRKTAKGRLAIKLGRGVEASKGATGTLKILDVNGKPVGVFKVSNEYIPLAKRALNFIKSWAGGQLSYLSSKYMAQPKSERAAFVLSRALELDLAPASSREMFLQNKAGIFQVFLDREKNQGVLKDIKDANLKIEEHAESPVKNPLGVREDVYFEAIKLIDFIEQKHAFTEAEKTKFQKFAIFDYLIGNLDRHEENWFVTMSAKGEITNIKAIDNANAFPRKQPRKISLAVGNQYKWKSLKISHQHFTRETKEFIREKFSPEKLDEYLSMLNQDPQDFLDADMTELLKLRADVIMKLVLEPDTTPAYLASFSTKEEMENFVHRQ